MTSRDAASCSTGKVAALLAWCDAADVWIDPRIQLVDADDHTDRVGGHRSGQGSGICVYSRDKLIEPLTTLVTIPKTAVLSVRSSFLHGHIPDVAPYGHGAQLALSLALYGELLQGPCSHWFGYLQSLPPRRVPVALLWGAHPSATANLPNNEDLEDQTLARAWATGTEIEREMLSEDGGDVLESIRKYYVTTAYPVLSRLSNISEVTEEGFLHAYSLVSSRAFMVDAYHGLAMVPIADAFNHTQDHHVHLESDHDVCVACGSLSQCSHDSEEHEEQGMHSSPSSFRQPPSATPPDTCDMVANGYVPPFSEVFNTYGEALSNAQLVARYGFALEDGNEHDVVSWDVGELRTVLVSDLNMEAPSLWWWDSVVRAWPREDVRWRGSGLVYQPAKRGLLHVNSDARMSHPLWVYCALASMLAVYRIGGGGGGTDVFLGLGESRGSAGGLDSALDFLGRLADELVYLETEEPAESETTGPAGGTTSDDDARELNDGVGKIVSTDWDRMHVQDQPLHQHHANPSSNRSGRRSATTTTRRRLGDPLVRTDRSPPSDMVSFAVDEVLPVLCRTVVRLCQAKANRLGRDPHTSTPALGESLDALEGSRCALAMREVICERSLLESCEASWEELLDAYYSTLNVC